MSPFFALISPQVICGRLFITKFWSPQSSSTQGVLTSGQDWSGQDSPQAVGGEGEQGKQGYRGADQEINLGFLVSQDLTQKISVEAWYL